MPGANLYAADEKTVEEIATGGAVAARTPMRRRRSYSFSSQGSFSPPNEGGDAGSAFGGAEQQQPVAAAEQAAAPSRVSGGVALSRQSSTGSTGSAGAGGGGEAAAAARPVSLGSTASKAKQPGDLKSAPWTKAGVTTPLSVPSPSLATAGNKLLVPGAFQQAAAAAAKPAASASTGTDKGIPAAGTGVVAQRAAALAAAAAAAAAGATATPKSSAAAPSRPLSGASLTPSRPVVPPVTAGGTGRPSAARHGYGGGRAASVAGAESEVEFVDADEDDDVGFFSEEGEDLASEAFKAFSPSPQPVKPSAGAVKAQQAAAAAAAAREAAAAAAKAAAASPAVVAEPAPAAVPDDAVSESEPYSPPSPVPPQAEAATTVAALAAAGVEAAGVAATRKQSAEQLKVAAASEQQPAAADTNPGHGSREDAKRKSVAERLAALEALNNFTEAAEAEAKASKAAAPPPPPVRGTSAPAPLSPMEVCSPPALTTAVVDKSAVAVGAAAAAPSIGTRTPSEASPPVAGRAAPPPAMQARPLTAPAEGAAANAEAKEKARARAVAAAAHEDQAAAAQAAAVAAAQALHARWDARRRALLAEAGLTDDANFERFAEACEGKGFFVGCEDDEDGQMWTDRYRKMISVYQRSPDERKAEQLKGKASQFVRTGQIARAIECYNEAIDLVPGGGKTHVYLTNRAALLCREGALEPALADCRRATALAPGYAKAHSRAGYVYSCMGRVEDAIQAYEQAVMLDPTDPSNAKLLSDAVAALEARVRDEDARRRETAAAARADGGAAAAAVAHAAAAEATAARAALERMRAVEESAVRALGGYAKAAKVFGASADNLGAQLEMERVVRERLEELLAREAAERELAAKKYAKAKRMLGDEDAAVTVAHRRRSASSNGGGAIRGLLRRGSRAGEEGEGDDGAAPPLEPLNRGAVYATPTQIALGMVNGTPAAALRRNAAAERAAADQLRAQRAELKAAQAQIEQYQSLINRLAEGPGTASPEALAAAAEALGIDTRALRAEAEAAVAAAAGGAGNEEEQLTDLMMQGGLKTARARRLSAGKSLGGGSKHAAGANGEWPTTPVTEASAAPRSSPDGRAVAEHVPFVAPRRALDTATLYAIFDALPR